MINRSNLQIEIDAVSKVYGSTSVLRDVSLQIHEGELVVLVGPSGCGKSTLLRLVAGLDSPSSGDIRIRGSSVTHLSAKDRNLAMVFQSYALYPHMSVSDNMSFALRLSGASKAERHQKVLKAAGILGIETLLDRMPRDLSGGQRQRVAMGRAIVRDPIAFLFDEPLSNLDARFRARMRTELKDLHRQLGKPTIYVTHDQIEAMTMADRVVVMNDGRVAQVGPPEELYNNPRSLFVASFIGTPEINLIAAFAADPSAAFVTVAGGSQLPINKPLGLASGTPVTCGVRPQDVLIADGGLHATVRLIELMGAHSEVTAQIANQDIRLVVRNDHGLSADDSILLRATPGKTLIFDAGSGTRIA